MNRQNEWTKPMERTNTATEGFFFFYHTLFQKFIPYVQKGLTENKRGAIGQTMRIVLIRRRAKL